MSNHGRAFLIRLFEAAVAAADPKQALTAHLPEKPEGRTIVIGAGKGAAQLAAAFEELWDGPLEGVVVTRYGYGCPTRQVKVLEAAHPVPDAAGLAASQALFDAISGLSEKDLVVALICGGGSALLPAPSGDMTLADEVDLNRALLKSGAPISVMNAIRKQVSRIKGGRLAAAAFPARVVSLIVSDVPGDDPAQVASGPTVPDMTTRQDARKLIETWRIKLPAKISGWMADDEGLAPLPADPVFARNSVTVIASARLSLEAAAWEAARHGIPAVILSDSIEGEARDIAQMHAAIAREVATRNRPFQKPVVILSGGETTVTLRGRGRGGRNSEFLLSFAIAAGGIAYEALAADTDGIDGSENNAGVFADSSSMARLRATGMDPRAMLAVNDAYTAFEAIGGLFIPGPTGTNVNDFRAIVLK